MVAVPALAINKGSCSAGIAPSPVPAPTNTLPAVHTREGVHLPFSFIATENNLILKHWLTRALVQGSSEMRDQGMLLE